MAYQTKQTLWLPNYVLIPASLDATTLLVDASGEKAAFIIKVAKTGTLNKVGFRTGAVVQNQTIRVSFQDVSTSTGNPDETQDQFRDISISDTDDNVWKETGLITSDGTDSGTKRSVTRGDMLAIVWESNPFNSGDVFRLSMNPLILNDYYADLKTSGSWVKQSGTPNIALYYDDGAGNSVVQYCPHLGGFSAVSAPNWNSGSSPPKRGLKFQVPFPCYTNCAMFGGGLAAGADVLMKLYDSDGSTVLQTAATQDGDITRSTSTRTYTFWWPTEQLLQANTYYYAMVEPQTANAVNWSLVDVNAAAILDQQDGGQQFHYVDNSGGGGSFVPTTTRRAFVQIGFDMFPDSPTGMILSRVFTGF